MRMYESIWQGIKELPTKEELPVRIHRDAAARLIQAVKLEKTKEVAVKKKLGLLRPGRLIVRRTEDTLHKSPNFSIVYFSLREDYSKLL